MINWHGRHKKRVTVYNCRRGFNQCMWSILDVRFRLCDGPMLDNYAYGPCPKSVTHEIIENEWIGARGADD